jgi:hypothetical protein
MKIAGMQGMQGIKKKQVHAEVAENAEGKSKRRGGKIWIDTIL